MQQDDAAVTTHRVAVFDLDGTVTRHDTLVPFLVGWAVRHPRHLWRLWRLPFSLSRFALGLSDRGRLKASLVRQVMQGAGRDSVAAWADEFCRSRLPALLNPGALAAIESHRAAGDRLVLLSASVDLYVPAIGRALGFDETICSGVAWTAGRLDGRLQTANRRDEEKARCFRAAAVAHPGMDTVAYGNSASDLPHMVLATQAPELTDSLKHIKVDGRDYLVFTLEGKMIPWDAIPLEQKLDPVALVEDEVLLSLPMAAMHEEGQCPLENIGISLGIVDPCILHRNLVGMGPYNLGADLVAGGIQRTPQSGRLEPPDQLLGEFVGLFANGHHPCVLRR